MQICVVTEEPVTAEEKNILEEAFASEEPKKVLTEKLEGFNNLVEDHDGNPLIMKAPVAAMQENRVNWQYLEV